MNPKHEFLFEVNDLKKHFHKEKIEIPVLKGVQFSVRPGETVAIVGSSGAGKSTLLHILGTLETPSAGQVFYKGKNIFSLSQEERCEFRNRHLGFVFQFHHLLPEFSALENIMMPGWIAGLPETEVLARAKDLLERVGLGQRANHKPSELSGGESQRVALARALTMNPELILADEFTGNLDSANSDHLVSLLLEMNRERNVTLIAVTHDMKIAEKMSRVLEMKDGLLL